MVCNFYKPSGKSSPVFFLYLLLSFIFIIPIFSFLQAAVLYYSPILIIDLSGVAICLFFVASLCGYWCIEKGKVRSKKAAVISTVLISLLFMYMFLIFYCAFYENRLKPMEITALITTPSNLSDSIKSILEQGITISGRYLKNIRLRGIILIVLGVVGFLLTEVILLINFLTLVGRPFMEKRKQWAKEIVLEFEYIEDKNDFINKIITANLDYIIRLPILQNVNVSHSSFELYPMEDHYYLSVYNRRAKFPDKKGQVKFETEELFEYLSISKQTGDMLLANQIHCSREQANAKIISKSTKRREKLSLLKSGVVGGLFYYFMFLAYRSGQIEQSDFSGPAMVLCAAACVIFYVLSAIGCFVKEDVIVLDNIMFGEDWQPSNAMTNVYRVEKKDSGLLYKAFYLLMSIISIGFLAFTIYYIWGMKV